MAILATLCYVVDGDKVLMLHRNKKKNDWHEGRYNGLGGKFISGEGPEECMVREVFEESGYIPEAWQLRGVIAFPKFDGENDWQCFIFRIDRWRGTQTECLEGTLEWVAIADLQHLPMWPGDRHFLPRVFEDSGWFSGVIRYDEKKVSSWQLRDYGYTGR